MQENWFGIPKTIENPQMPCKLLIHPTEGEYTLTNQSCPSVPSLDQKIESQLASDTNLG
jgi:hypothetical protein